MIFRPVSPQSRSRPPTTKLPVGLTKKSDAFLGIQPAGSDFFTCPSIMSLIMPALYFLPLAVASRCWVEATTLVGATGVAVPMLGGDPALGGADALAVHIAHRDLALGVRLQVRQLARAAGLAQDLEDPVREVDRGRHERALLVFFAVAAGGAETQAPVP